MMGATCPHCSKTFYNVSVKNRHIRKVHLLQVENTKQKKNHIFCPLCSDDSKHNFATYILLTQHITDVHNIVVKQENLIFPSHEAFESWMALEARNVNYAKERSVKDTDKKTIYYNCNRSNTNGRFSIATKRMAPKSIKINGVCPSRIIAHFKNNGQVEVNFIETHVGHTSNLRKQRLTKAQREELVKKLKAGIPKRRIVKEAREMKGKENERMKFLDCQTLANLSAQFNITKNRRDPNDDDLKSVADEDIDQQNLCIKEESKEILKDAGVECISETAETLNNVDERQLENVSKDKYIENIKQRLFTLLNHMPFENYKKAMNEILPILERYSKGNCSKKRKVDKQSDFPNQKKQRIH